MSNPTTPTYYLGRAALSDGTAARRLPSLPQIPERTVTPTQSSPVSYKRSGDGFLMPEPKRSRTLEASAKATWMAGMFQETCDELLEEIQAWVKEEDHRSDAIEMRKVVNGWIQAVHTALAPEKLLPEELKLLDLRLPLPAWLSPTRRTYLEAANTTCTQFGTSIKLAQTTLLSPSEFGKPGPDGWERGQRETSRILCLRPTEKNGVPLCALHDVFRRFMLNAGRPLPEDSTTTVSAVNSAQMLCNSMGEPFDNEAARSTEFDTCVQQLFDGWTRKHPLNASSDLHCSEVNVNRVLLGPRDIPICLREDKWEPGQGGSDVYMQLARSYDLAIKVLHENTSNDSTWSRFLEQGSPMFLISVLGPQLSVMGGFYDGEHVIVEPLGDTYYMLYDSMGMRQRKLAKVLYALAKGRSMLESLIATPQRMTFPASTPRIYGSCTLYAEAGTTVGATVGNLTFECPLFTDSERQLFSATLSLSPSSEHSQKPVVVKLVDRSYGAHVHHLLACHGFAPILYGYARREGAPTAYVMERLGSDWVILFQFLEVEPPGTGFAAPISTSLQQLLELLDKEHVVHGDLRTNNIMLQVDDEGKPVISDRSANIKVIDYDWAGNAGEVRYPPSRNEYIAGIKWPGKPGGLIESGHDRQLVESWWHF